MAPIEGVIQVQGDITNARTSEVVRWSCNRCTYAARLSGSLMDVKRTWLSMMAPLIVLALLNKWSITILHVFMVLLFLTLLWMIAVTGLHDMDDFVQSQLILANNMVLHYGSTNLLYFPLMSFLPHLPSTKSQPHGGFIYRNPHLRQFSWRPSTRSSSPYYSNL